MKEGNKAQFTLIANDFWLIEDINNVAKLVLGEILSNYKDKPLVASKIGDAIGRGSSSMTVIMNDLVENGYLIKDEDTDNRWTLTPKALGYKVDWFPSDIEVFTSDRDVSKKHGRNDILQLMYMLNTETNLYQIKGQINKYKYNDNLSYDEMYDKLFYYFVLLGKEYKPQYGIGLIPYINVPPVILNAMGTETMPDLIAQFKAEDAADDEFIEKLIANSAPKE